MRIAPRLVAGSHAVFKGIQHNIRVSREYRPYLFGADPNVSECGPLKITVVEPFKVIRLELAPNEYGLAFDMEWRAVIPAHEEIPNYTRVRGRMNQNYLRYNQVAVVNGWVEVAGERFEMENWWGGRDHSWGIRTDVAGGEPVTGIDPPRSAVGTLWSWLIFGTLGDNGTWTAPVPSFDDTPDDLAISPDGTLAAFTRLGRIYGLRLDGSSQPFVAAESAVGLSGATFSPDSSQLVIKRDDSAFCFGTMHIVPAAPSTPTHVTAGDDSPTLVRNSDGAQVSSCGSISWQP